MCVCVCVLCMAERMNMTLGKFERIMEYANIVLCIRKICRVQMKDLILGGGLYEDVRVHGEEILLVDLYEMGSFFLFYSTISVLEFFQNFSEPKIIGN